MAETTTPIVNLADYPLLRHIDSPRDLRRLAPTQLRQVCAEVRQYMVDVICQVGGHFGAGLGVVELTVAAHYAFDTPKDKIILDTGHQGYPHKILTGRRDELHTIRQKGGLSPFLKRSESIFDVFGAGHASTSISAALGVAAARDLRGDDYHVVSIIGDGAMTGGMVYEAMNNCGVQNRRVIVVLNDNRMSIAPNVWAISNYFTQIAQTSVVQKIRGGIWDITGEMGVWGDRLRRVASRLEGGVKSVLTPGMLFESLGFHYFGPENGHNVNKLVDFFEFAKTIDGPVLLHITTEKGKGYAPAEADVAQRLHALSGPTDKATGRAITVPGATPKPPKYQTVFGKALVEIARKDRRVVGITAAMPDGTSLDLLQQAMPDRFFDVGIAEEHAVTFAAGLATEGAIPVVAIYSSFMQRGFDQIVHDCAIQHLPVVFALDRAGIAGNDGPTHHGSLDLSYLRIVQDMIVMAPKDEQELRDMLFTAINNGGGPVAIRYPRGEGLGVELRDGFSMIEIGRSETLREGEDIAIVAIGDMVPRAMAAAEILGRQGVSVEVVNARFARPVDGAMLDDLCERFDRILTLENNVVAGGFGSAVLEHIASTGRASGVTVRVHGLPADSFVEHGNTDELLAELDLMPDGIARVVREFMGLPAELKDLVTV
ncbi:MAG TPA: 1-deoxy-D-xylulose-5-phosphate synthase [Candidatus Kapabacteria bacterium]|nr:1-deoxy-D-xylulose-5-phosphate synthase [Candidatus Kapabacteria bacterium]